MPPPPPGALRQIDPNLALHEGINLGAPSLRIYHQVVREGHCQRIEKKYPDHRVLAKDVLAWLTFAKRPLQVAELRAAVAVKETNSNLDEESLIDIEDMVSVCAGLVTVDERSQTGSLIHYTTQEYLERTRANWRLDADAEIAT